MASFRYQAVNRSGEVEHGRLDAGSVQEAVTLLGRNALTPLDVREAAASGAWRHWLAPRSSSHVRRSEMVLLCQQLASLVRSGMTLDRSLAIAAQLPAHPRQHKLLQDLLQRVRRGSSFAEALEHHRAVFPGYFVSMVRAGEASGSLPETLGRLSALLSRGEEARQKVISALVYPAILMAMIGVTLALILGFVLPRFEALFAEAGAQLPLPTRLVMGLGRGFRDYGWFLAAGAALGLLAGRRALGKPEVRRRLDRWLLARPLIGPVITSIESGRFARTVSTLTGGGMPLPAALRIARGSFYNQALSGACEALITKVAEGAAFADSLSRSGLYPPLLVQMAKVGEETGRLHDSLAEAAETLEAQAQRTIERGLVALVPAVTILMGALVAALIGSVLVGILSVNDLAS